jgi:hypothetical protein
MVKRQPKGASSSKGGQFAKDMSGKKPPAGNVLPDVGEPAEEDLTVQVDVPVNIVFDVYKQHAKDPSAEYVDVSDDEWLCVCGNTSDNNGFYAYDEGEEVEPDDDWDGSSYFCAACARVFNMNTGEVVDQPETITNMDGHLIRASYN